MTQCDIGLIGLAVMGQNLVLNMERNGYSVAVYNRTSAKTKAFIEGPAKSKNIIGTFHIDEFVRSLNHPRKILLMVKAGTAVDMVINELRPLLNKGDLIIDGGNSFYKDTERRFESMANEGFYYLGAGISGGEKGALLGPSIMPGGSQNAYILIESILTAIAAKTSDERPCVAYLGPRSAGHYVKMVHNGIEYAFMQLIAEVYDILHRGLGMTSNELHDLFASWNEGELKSYLIEITRDIFKYVDEITGNPLLDMIVDEAKQKGTGKWTSQDALDLGVPTPTINAAVEARIISAYKSERIKASEILRGPMIYVENEKAAIVNIIRDALLSSIICAFAQGFALLQAASNQYQYDYQYSEIARIWRAGCIIRARLLEKMRMAFERDQDLDNLLTDPEFANSIENRQDALRQTIVMAVENGIPVPALSSALAYIDAYRSARLPANLTQAQRDYFGAHTYRRVDQEGTFHTVWEDPNL
jgi:6-phosphogluconate dehydrogenase